MKTIEELREELKQATLAWLEKPKDAKLEEAMCSLQISYDLRCMEQKDENHDIPPPTV